MSKIVQLDRKTSELIAAGEVVERPASVVKELIENSIDAGASRITVEIENGGMTYIRVADNGCGMERDDAVIAFERHATSKIKTADDLAAINTLGFRGEALAATAAVSRIDLLTKAQGEDIGTHIRIEGGEIKSVSDAGCPAGTTIIVRDLFYNTPARLKFMKRDATEAGYVAQAVSHAALSRPDKSFSFIKNSAGQMFTPGNGDLKSAVYAVYGAGCARELIPVDSERDNMTVHGFISKPETSRMNRSMQDFFVNGRYIRSKVIGAALEEAYRERIAAGRYPYCVLILTMPPVSLDVNIHPAKTEIKFANDKRVFDFVYSAVAAALDGDTERPDADALTGRRQSFDVYAAPSAEQIKIDEKKLLKTQKQDEKQQPESAENAAETAPVKENKTPVTEKTASEHIQRPYTGFSGNTQSVAGSYSAMGVKHFAQSNDGGAPAASAVIGDSEHRTYLTLRAPDPTVVFGKEPEKSEAETETGGYKVIGELFSTYIVVQEGKEALLIDKHAAHERLIFNQLMSENDPPPPQLLLSPVAVSVTPGEAALLLGESGTLEKAGFALESFGTGTVLVRQIPAYVSEQDVPAVISELAAMLKNGRIVKSELYMRILERVACTAAVKANSFTSDFEREKFVEKIMAMPEVKYCPHGRPIAVRISRSKLEKMFGRT